MTAFHNIHEDPTELRKLGVKLLRTADRVERGHKPLPSKGMQEILTEVCKAALVPKSLITAVTRRAEVFKVRAEAMRQMHDEHGWSKSQIAMFFKKDRATVLNAVRRAREWKAIIT